MPPAFWGRAASNSAWLRLPSSSLSSWLNRAAASSSLTLSWPFIFCSSAVSSSLLTSPLPSLSTLLNRSSLWPAPRDCAKSMVERGGGSMLGSAASSSSVLRLPSALLSLLDNRSLALLPPDWPVRLPMSSISDCSSVSFRLPLPSASKLAESFSASLALCWLRWL